MTAVVRLSSRSRTCRRLSLASCLLLLALALTELPRTVSIVVLPIVRTRLVTVAHVPIRTIAVVYVPIRTITVARLREVVAIAVTFPVGILVPRTTITHMPVGRLVDRTVLVVANRAAVATTPIVHIHLRGLTEVVTTIVARVDIEHPASPTPSDGLVEVYSGDIDTILPCVQHEAQVGVPSVPVHSEHILLIADGEEVVQVDFIDSLILIHCQMQLIRHLVTEE